MLVLVLVLVLVLALAFVNVESTVAADDARVSVGLRWGANFRGSGWGRSKEGENAVDHDGVCGLVCGLVGFWR